MIGINSAYKHGWYRKKCGWTTQDGHPVWCMNMTDYKKYIHFTNTDQKRQEIRHTEML